MALCNVAVSASSSAGVKVHRDVVWFGTVRTGGTALLRAIFFPASTVCLIACLLFLGIAGHILSHPCNTPALECLPYTVPPHSQGCTMLCITILLAMIIIMIILDA